MVSFTLELWEVESWVLDIPLQDNEVLLSLPYPTSSVSLICSSMMFARSMFPLLVLFRLFFLFAVTTLQWVATITTTLAQMVYRVVTRGGMSSYTNGWLT